MTAQQDYRFTAVVTWNPPVYPYKTPYMYLLKWTKEGEIFVTGVHQPVSEIILPTIIIAHVAAKLTSPCHGNAVKELILLLALHHRVMTYTLGKLVGGRGG